MFAIVYVAGLVTAIAALTAFRHCPRLVQVTTSKRGNRYLAIRLPKLPRVAALPVALGVAALVHAAVIVLLVAR